MLKPDFARKSCWLLLTISVSCFSGCITFTKDAIPASRLPNRFQAPSKCNLNPINFTLLQGTFPAEHQLDAGDVIALSIMGVIPADPKEAPPIISGQATLAREYYPPQGMVDTPSYGLPVHVQSDGTIQLPLLTPLEVGGLSLQQAAEKIRAAYTAEEIMREGNDHVSVVLLRSRVNRVLVLREDASTESANLIAKGQTVLHKRGSATVVDLPAYESDVLHALATSGGLPGIDAYNEVWVLRRASFQEGDVEQIQSKLDATSSTDIASCIPPHVEAICLPLKLCSGEPIPFSSADVILRDGDVVYIEPRRDEYFYSGGLLPGGQIPLPRDEDVDVLEAVALATGSIGGLGGTSSVAVLRAGAGIGAVIPPTRVLVLRKLPDGQQISIRVDLERAMKDPNERIRIMPGDFVMSYYKPGEMLGNSALNFFNLNYTLR